MTLRNLHIFLQMLIILGLSLGNYFYTETPSQYIKTLSK